MRKTEEDRGEEDINVVSSGRVRWLWLSVEFDECIQECLNVNICCPGDVFMMNYPDTGLS